MNPATDNENNIVVSSPVTVTLNGSAHLTESVYLDDSQDLDDSHDFIKNIAQDLTQDLTQSYDFTNEYIPTISFDYDDINKEISKFKLCFIGLTNLQEGEKVWIENNILTVDQSEYYSTPFLQSVSRYWNNQGRQQLFEYIDLQFTEFVKLLDLCKSAQEFDQSDTKIISVNDTLEEYVDRIIPGLHNLKKTYEGESNLIAKIESIILTFIDYKDFLEKERRQKQIREQKQKQTQTQTQNNTGYKNIKIVTTSNKQQGQFNEKGNANNIFVNFQKTNTRHSRTSSF